MVRVVFHKRFPKYLHKRPQKCMILNDQSVARDVGINFRQKLKSRRRNSIKKLSRHTSLICQNSSNKFLIM